MGITPIKCYNVKSGYMFTGKLNRWCDGSNKAFLKNFSYYVTEDLNGNINLVQGDCDFTGMPKGESLTWWTGAAKVLIKKIKKPAGKLKEIIDSLNQDAKTLGLKFSGDSAMHLATFIINQKNGYKAWKSRVDPDKPMDLRDYGRVRKGEVTFVRFGSHSFREPQGPPPTPEGTNWWAFCIDEGELGFWRLAVQ